MIKPLLYLLHKGRPNSSTRHKVTEDLLALTGVQPSASAHPSAHAKNPIVIVDLAHIDSAHLLASAVTRHPQLTRLEVRLYGAEMTDWPESIRALRNARVLTPLPPQGKHLDGLESVGLWVCMHSTLQGMLPALRAMAGGIPVLVPDALPEEALFMRDGVNGFLYRAGDPDSLALSLLTIPYISKDLMHRVAEQARRSISSHLAELSLPFDVLTTREQS